LCPKYLMHYLELEKYKQSINKSVRITCINITLLRDEKAVQWWLTVVGVCKTRFKGKFTLCTFWLQFGVFIFLCFINGLLFKDKFFPCLYLNSTTYKKQENMKTPNYGRKVHSVVCPKGLLSIIINSAHVWVTYEINHLAILKHSSQSRTN
jgi:hypothetical protein